MNSSLDTGGGTTARAGRPALRLAEFPEDLDAVRAIFRDYEAAAGVPVCFQGFERELDELPGAFTPPKGALIVAGRGDRLAGCVALRACAEGCEIKRLFVRPEARGAGLGRALASAALAAARAAGYARVVLETHATMTIAHALYGDLGFVSGPADTAVRRMALDLA